MTQKTIRIGVLEDDEDMRGFISTIIGQSDQMEVVFTADTVKDAIQLARDNVCDLCLVDIQLPDGSGLEFIETLFTHSKPKVLILTVLGDKVSVLTALQAGADGYLLKDSKPNQIYDSIHTTLAGATPISPQAATHLLDLVNTSSANNQPTNQGDQILTERELEVLTLFSKGLSYEESAKTLDISKHTIGDHVKSIYKKLSVHSKNEAIYEAVQSGLIKL